MKVRKNKLKIVALKIAHRNSNILPLFKYLDSYWKISQYIFHTLVDEGYIILDNHTCVLTDKGRKFLQKVAPRFTL